VISVAVARNGRLAVSASSDKMVKVWDLELGQPLATFSADAALRCCAFAGTQTLLAGDVVGHVYFLEFEHAQTANEKRPY
jgi:hypothetical protein